MNLSDSLDEVGTYWKHTNYQNCLPKETKSKYASNE